MEARDERRLLNLQRQLSCLNLLIIDELGFVPLSPTGAELLFEVFGSERLTGALLDRLTHHVHILEMNGDSYRLVSLFLILRYDFKEWIGVRQTATTWVT